MICPYCSTDMEPIELNGKAFCSNCGLSVGSSTPSQDHAQASVIRHLDSPAADISDSVEPKSTDEQSNNSTKPAESLDSLATQFSPLKNEAVLNTQNEPGFYDATSLESLGSAKNKELPISDLTSATKPLDDTVAKENDESIKQDEPSPSIAATAKETSGSDKDSIPQVKPEDKPKILMSILSDEPNDIRVLQNAEKPVIEEDNNDLANKIKEVDQLGSAGILLDIISDEAVFKQKENELTAMKEATSLLDKVQAGDSKTPDDDKTDAKKPIKGASEFSPKGAKIIKVNILDNSVVNPIIHPELEAGPEELNLPNPEDFDLETNPNSESLDQIDNIVANESPENIDFSQSINADKTKSIEEIFGKLPEEKSTVDFKEEAEIPAKKLADKPIEEKNDNSHETTDPEPEPEIINKFTADEIKEALGDVTVPPESNISFSSVNETSNSNQKSEHLQKYFSSILSNGKGKKKKKLTKAEKRKKRNTMILWLAFISLFSIAAFALYFYENYQSQPIQETTKLYETDTAEQATLPKEIPVGYEKDVTIVDSENNSYATEYIFSADNTRKLVLKEEKSNQSEEALAKYITSQTGKYEVKDIEGKSYTIFENGSIAWTTENKLFTITAIGETYNDMVEKMAISMER